MRSATIAGLKQSLMMSNFSDAYVGVMVPADADRTLVEQFENYLKELTVLKEQEMPDLTTKEKEQLSTKIAKYLVKSMLLCFYSWVRI